MTAFSNRSHFKGCADCFRESASRNFASPGKNGDPFLDRKDVYAPSTKHAKRSLGSTQIVGYAQITCLEPDHHVPYTLPPNSVSHQVVPISVTAVWSSPGNRFDEP